MSDADSQLYPLLRDVDARADAVLYPLLLLYGVLLLSLA